MEFLFLIGRVLYGGFFVLSGYNHFRNVSTMTPYAAAAGVPKPKVAVLGSGLVALLGGLSILLGSWPPLGVLFLALFLLPVSFMMHDFWADTDPQMKQMNRIQFEKNMALLGAALMFLVVPQPWPLALVS